MGLGVHLIVDHEEGNPRRDHHAVAVHLPDKDQDQGQWSVTCSCGAVLYVCPCIQPAPKEKTP